MHVKRPSLTKYNGPGRMHCVYTSSCVFSFTIVTGVHRFAQLCSARTLPTPFGPFILFYFILYKNTQNPTPTAKINDLAALQADPTDPKSPSRRQSLV
jgi:hypothetical protein